MSRVGGPVVLVAARVVAISTFVADIFGCPFDAAALQRLAAFNSDADCLQVNDREQHALLHQCQSVSALSNGVFDGALRRRATFRGIGTLHKIVTTLGANRDAAMPPCREYRQINYCFTVNYFRRLIIIKGQPPCLAGVFRA